jgi:Trypsin-like peptidase domain
MRLVTSLSIVLLVCVLGCAAKTQTMDGPLIRLFDYVGQGQKCAIKYLHNKVPLAESAVVRIHVNYNKTGISYTDHGAGCLIKGGFVITAGHCLDVLDEHSDAEVRIVLIDGRQISATPFMRKKADGRTPKNDWALLRTEESYEMGLTFGDRVSDSSVVVMGYPGRIGFDKRGDPKFDRTDIALPLRPAILICKTAKATDDFAIPIAGAIPIGGMSGAPVINDAGKIVGIQDAVTDDETGNSTIRMAFVDEPQKAIHELIK